MDKYLKYINKAVRVRYFRKMVFYKKRKDPVSGNEKYMDVTENVPFTNTGLVWGVTPTKLILMSFEDDSEIYIKIADIRTIKEVKGG